MFYEKTRTVINEQMLFLLWNLRMHFIGNSIDLFLLVFLKLYDLWHFN